MSTTLLQLEHVNTHYGPLHILQDVTLAVHPGEIVCLLGGNASGKSTTLKTILGLVTPTSGEVRFAGEPMTGLPTAERIRRGLAVVPENRRLFGSLTVHENLLMGAYLRTDHPQVAADLERVLTLFPLLHDRRRQIAGTLSGGEQQMVALGRVLLSRPRLILMDEPSMGLAPRLLEQTLRQIAALRDEGLTVLLVEQNANLALQIADRGYVLQTGRIVLDGRAAKLLDNTHLRRAYLGR